MNLEPRIEAFGQLGKYISGLPQDVFDNLCSRTLRENPWFTPENVALSLKGIIQMLNTDVLTQWTSFYDLQSIKQRTIGVAMAGNIPLVGFHDFLCVLISGHRLKVKLSSQDTALLTHLAEQLIQIEPAFRDLVQFSDRLHHIDAMIATGSDNTARYFEYYFRSIPHIIRKNRSSCAILTGKESKSELNLLGTDVFSYFGLGCRSISKLYVPEKYDVTKLFQEWTSHGAIINHNKYFNNYEYQRSILLVNKIPFFDNGFVLLKDDSALVSPISVLYFEFYLDQNDLLQKIESHRQKIQCIISSANWFTECEKFGEAQFPRVGDYSDKIDTLQFLSEV